MRVSVIIPVYNEEKVIKDCLVSLSKQKMGDFEVILVDDGSTDKTLEVMSELRINNYELRVLRQKHLGPGMARNLGAKHAKGDILVFVDADMTFDRVFSKKLIAPIVSGKAKGTFSKEEYISNWNNVWARCWNYNENLPRRRRHPDNYPDRQKVFRAIKKSEFARVGGFSSGGYTDDYTLFEKLGFEAEAAVGARFYHENPDNLKEVFNQAKWVAKRKYKLGIAGFFYALLRVSLPMSKLVGIYKSIRYRTAAFLIFKIVYNTGITVGIIDYYLFGKGTK